MKVTLYLLALMLFSVPVLSQDLSQTIRGSVVDEDTGLPLLGATVMLQGNNLQFGDLTDIEGGFRMDGLAPGRYDVMVSYLGYEERVISNLVLHSAKELVLEIELTESPFAIDEIVVKSTEDPNATLNDMALVSSRSISAEETSRYAGGFNDPSRITSNFAGVTNTQDGSNDIIVRGNSPKYIQWRLEGSTITNPNHFADQNAVSGVLSALNNNLLGTSDFYTGAFPANFGNALSGVYDLRLRKGNNENFEGTASLGLLGTDVTLEGPFSKNYSGSYLANYRYSTIGLVTDIGLVDLDAILNYQDASFKLWLPTEKLGSFSLFGLAGKSNFIFEDVDPSLWVTPGDNFMQEDIVEDYNKEAHLFNLGVNHFKSIKDKGYLKTSLLFSSEGVDDEIFENILVQDEITERRPNFRSNIKKSTLHGNTVMNYRLNPRHKIKMGAIFSYFNYEMTQSSLDENANRVDDLDFDEGVALLSGFVNWKYDVSQQFSLLAGLHSSNVLLNNKHTLEPRISFKYDLSGSSDITLGYGNHSMMESIPHYFYETERDGERTRINSDLGLLRANHIVLGWEKQLNSLLSLKLETYYQQLYNIPVQNDIESTYSTINEGLEFQYVDLVNEGKGKNFGIELTLERRLDKGYYFLLNATRYESKYKALDGEERNTAYNGKYLANVLFGKEFYGLGKKDNQIFAVNAKIFYGGARYITPLLRDGQGLLAVKETQGEFYDLENVYSQKLDDTYNVTLNLSYKWNRSKTTHELFLNLNNMTNKQSRLTEYYDIEENDGVGYQRQVGFYPDLLYRVYF